MSVRRKTILQVVAEMPEFIKQAGCCMDEESRISFIDHIAGNPLEGKVIVGTGGARKIRWTADHNQGKSGGVRVIYYYHSHVIPIFLFTVYGKSQKANISPKERHTLKTIISKIVDIYEDNGHE